MMYQNLSFPNFPARPFFYTNFVATVDGKVAVKKSGYWPIGSSIDHDVLIELRACSDVLIHGYKTAVGFKAVESLENPKFADLRKTGEKHAIWYMVISNHPKDELLSAFNPQFSSKQFLVTSETAVVSDALQEQVTLLRLGKEVVDLQLLSSYLHGQGQKHILVEGGPHLLGSFFKENLIDEVFLTIAPKIFGNGQGETLSMVEGYLFPPNQIKKLKLLSMKQIDDEVFLRYRIYA